MGDYVIYARNVQTLHLVEVFRTGNEKEANDIFDTLSKNKDKCFTGLNSRYVLVKELRFS